MTRRPAYTGTVDALPSGRYRARIRTSAGDRRTLGVFATRAEAEGHLDVHLRAMLERGAHPTSGVTVARLYESVIVRRRADGYRAVSDDESRWRTHLADTLGVVPAAELTTADVREWLASMALAGKAAQTRRNTLQLLRAVLAYGVDSGVLERNVATLVRVRERGRTERTSTSLTEAEAARLVDATIDAYPEIALAIATGLRAGEQAALEWRDVHDDHLLVRYGSPGQPTKSGKIRRVPLLPLAHRALDVARRLAGGSRWVHPGVDGPRYHIQPRRAWPELLAEAEADRHVRWHDLRHTCATLLLEGAPLLVGDAGPWSTREVQHALGHSTIAITERYLHSGDELALAAALRTAGPRVAHDAPGPASRQARNGRAPAVRIERTTFGLGNPGYVNVFEQLDALEGHARATRQAVASGSPFARQRALDLAAAASSLVAALRAELEPLRAAR